MSFFEKDGFRMHYEVYPGLAPRDTVFLHGNLASNIWWKPMLEVWKAQVSTPMKGSLILAEWRGNGESSGPRTEADLDVDLLAQDYIDLLKHLGVTKADIVGHSTGGVIALAALKNAPEIFNRCVLLDPAYAGGTELQEALVAAMNDMRTNKEMIAAVMGTTIHNNNPEAPLFKEIVDGVLNKVHPTNWAGVLRMVARAKFLPALKEIKQPVLLMHGEFDNVLPLEQTVEMAKLLPTSVFFKLNNQGHSCNVENPVRFVELTRAFLLT